MGENELTKLHLHIRMDTKINITQEILGQQ